MPNNNNFTHAPYLTTGNPLTENNRLNTNLDGTASVNITYFGPPAGELGQYYDFASAGRCQNVVLDSGATAATPAGIVAAHQAAYWKSRPKYIVTNDVRFAEGNAVGASTGAGIGTSQIAGVFQTAVTAGFQCFVQQQAPSATVLATAGGTAGQVLLPPGTTAGTFDTTAATTAPINNLGTLVTAVSAGTALVDLNIPSIP